MADDGSGNLSINVPYFGFTYSKYENLVKLINAKAWIIRKMTRADTLRVDHDGDYLCFPWFSPESTQDEIDAYMRLIMGLCETAKKKQRVMASERRLEDGDNEKFKARCFLLSLGFIGPEYAQARKILLAPMSGSGSFKSGNHMPIAVPSGFVGDYGGFGGVETKSDRGDDRFTHNTAAYSETQVYE